MPAIRQLVPLLVLLAGCSRVPILPGLTPYKMDIQQGNYVTQDMVTRLKPGMSKAQVRFALGTPLVVDPFHADRWDYVFSIRRRGTEPQLRSVVVLFDGPTLKSVETSGELPSEREFIASIDSQSKPKEVPSLALSDEQRKALPTPPPPSTADAVPDVAARTYPPLEPTP